MGVGAGDNRLFYTGRPIIFKHVYQVGGGDNPTTGVFTAPKAGLYLIFSAVVAEFHETYWAQIIINGSDKAGMMAYFDSGDSYAHQSASNLVVHQLQVGDRVWIQKLQGSTLYPHFVETSFFVIMINGPF
ncbi:protein HP-25 homolog 1-like [Saccostrea cucullata]|uniref:protein HP-25 homolog 1-like n=1 Tax=Saccostrea cuccullata TaxID=36930 RepID=UPI002ED5B8DA